MTVAARWNAAGQTGFTLARAVVPYGFAAFPIRLHIASRGRSRCDPAMDGNQTFQRTMIANMMTRLAVAVFCGSLAFGTAACTGGNGNNHNARGRGAGTPAAERPQAASLALAAGPSSAQYKITAPPPAQYEFNVSVIVPAGADVGLTAHTWYGATLSILNSTRGLQQPCHRRGSQNLCFERFPLLPAQRAGIWTIVAAKRSAPAAAVRVEITFAKP